MNKLRNKEPGFVPPDRIGDVLGEELPHEHITGDEITIEGGKVICNKKPYSREVIDKKNNRLQWLRIGCIECEIKGVEKEIAKSISKTENPLIVELTYISPFNYLGQETGKPSNVDNNEIKFLMTADYLRLLLRIEQIIKAYRQAPDAYKIDDIETATPKFIVIKTNQTMANFIIKRWGFLPVNNDYYVNFIKIEDAVSKIPDLVEYLKELKLRVEKEKTAPATQP